MYIVRSLWIGLCLLGCGSSPATVDAGFDAGEDEPQQAPLPPRDAPACAQTTSADLLGFERVQTWTYSDGTVQQDKAYPLTKILEDDSGVMSALASDATLGPISKAHEAKLRAAPAKCGTNVACYANELRFDDTESQTIGTALAPLMATITKTRMRPLGMFILHASGSDADLVTASWADTKNALNGTYDTYAASLDGPTLQSVVTAAATDPKPMAFFQPLLRVDLGALVAQKRDEATRYESLYMGGNQPAIAKIGAMSTSDWANYPFTVILVPGLGPSDLSTPISAGGTQRCDLAAARFQAKYAPFILVSGGHVHPDRTPYSEAMEMKKYLMTKYSIAESAIIVDPFARHTTTNLRNATREVLTYGIPIDRPMLITSDMYQSAYMAYWDGDFGPRCQNELGYLPWRKLAPIAPNDSCLLPSPLALQADGRDPLDP
jgi:DUF218 domain